MKWAFWIDFEKIISEVFKNDFFLINEFIFGRRGVELKELKWSINFKQFLIIFDHFDDLKTLV